MSLSLSPACSIMLFINLMILLMYTISIAFAQPAAFDHYTLAQQWPAGVCKSSTFKCINPIPSSFTIHGLWPSNKLSPHPRKCSPSFDHTKIKSLEPQLRIVWPNLKLTNTNIKFWKDQWDNHGSCSPWTQNDYFMKAMSLQVHNNLTTMLQAKGITPTGGPHQKQLITDAIKHKVHVDPFLVCAARRYLVEIHICFDVTTSLKHVNCPTPNPAQICGTHVIY
ncbi:hypothetical protein TSUD_390670 [Trifolium subterraneum]|uniref:Uncharacterized protein n=1 Tax=Trifolium subterraneum TaxID=3900 RepID=A0A2Z6M0V7_TRISU|nr:hypothetical protein TSUD_390670 [Trifolium subterraneum]